MGMFYMAQCPCRVIAGMTLKGEDTPAILVVDQAVQSPIRSHSEP